MNTTVIEEIIETHQELPGALLAEFREERGLTQEYVAGKLHLRVKVIELLEADDYDDLPEPVFIKGYLRAYAKLLGVNAGPLLETFSNNCKPEKKYDKALWQTKRQSHLAEHAVKWLTAAFAVGVIIAVSLWWHNSKGNEGVFSTKRSTSLAPLA